MSARMAFILLIFMTLGTGRLFAGDPGDGFALESATVRYAVAANPLSRRFLQVEGAVDFSLPFKWDLGKSWELEPRLDFSLGWLGKDHEDAVIGSVGPLLALGPRGFPVTIEGGVSPTLISRHDFGSSHLGFPFQFSNRIGIAWNVDARFRVGYWFQHMSNAGLGRPNPGLNLHFFSASYCF